MNIKIISMIIAFWELQDWHIVIRVISCSWYMVWFINWRAEGFLAYDVQGLIFYYTINMLISNLLLRDDDVYIINRIKN